MKSYKFISPAALVRFMVASLGVVAGGSVQAASTDTWTGSTSMDISAGSNYSGSPTIGTGDTLAFGSTNGQATNTLTDTGTLSLGGITFNSGALAYTLTGNSITLSATAGAITNSGTALETINNALVLSGTTVSSVAREPSRRRARAL
jgi:hypothetical protein